MNYYNIKPEYLLILLEFTSKLKQRERLVITLYENLCNKLQSISNEEHKFPINATLLDKIRENSNKLLEELDYTSEPPYYSKNNEKYSEENNGNNSDIEDIHQYKYDDSSDSLSEDDFDKNLGQKIIFKSYELDNSSEIKIVENSN